MTLRELPHPAGSKKIPVEMAVIDTGKGIGKEFLKEQLFHPFSQENPLQTGTGLGLAIVNSIVRSEHVNGKVDVWSSEGMGTEIRVSFDVEVIDDDDDMSSASSVVSTSSTTGRGHSVSLLAFSNEHRGHMLNLEVLSTYAAAWQFELKEEGKGDIIIIDGDDNALKEVQYSGRPIIYLTSGRPGQAQTIREAMNANGGSVQMLYKPIGPSAFRSALVTAVNYLEDQDGTRSRETTTPGGPSERPSISRNSSGASAESNSTVSELAHHRRLEPVTPDARVPLTRRRSEENEAAKSRPSMAPRGMTYHHLPQRPLPVENRPSGSSTGGSPQPSSPTSTISTISLADGGVMLKAATVPTETPRRETVPRVLVVEDNIINRRVLGAFLMKRVTCVI